MFIEPVKEPPQLLPVGLLAMIVFLTGMVLKLALKIPPPELARLPASVSWVSAKVGLMAQA